MAALVAGSLGFVTCTNATGTELIGEGRAVLFVGNSLTYVNDLPLIVQALADSAGTPALAVASVAFPDFSLQDHWLEGSARKRIRERSWDVVVLQQGPSALPESRELLLESVRLFAPEIRSSGATPALYSVWPQRDRAFDFQRSIESYTIAADDVNGMLLPVGSAWLAAWRRDPNLALYSSDGLHPTPAGSYLAGLVMHTVLSGQSPIGLPARLGLRNGSVLNIDPAVAALLQSAAAEVTTAATARR